MRRALPLLLVLAAALPANGAWSSRLDPVREAVLDKGEAVGVDERPVTREKRVLRAALRRLDRPRDSLLDDLRAAGPVCRRIDRAFPGDPLLDPVLGEALDALRGDALVERAALLAWMGRTGSDRGESILFRGIAKVDGHLQDADGAPDRAREAARMRAAMRSLEKTRRRLRLDLPRVGDPPFEGVAPDFSLADANPASPSGSGEVSPRDHLGGVTAWYFLHAT